MNNKEVIVYQGLVAPHQTLEGGFQGYLYLQVYNSMDTTIKVTMATLPSKKPSPFGIFKAIR
jgi:hypothetical protein